jgi:hypothetical protein
MASFVPPLLADEPSAERGRLSSPHQVLTFSGRSDEEQEDKEQETIRFSHPNEHYFNRSLNLMNDRLYQSTNSSKQNSIIKNLNPFKPAAPGAPPPPYTELMSASGFTNFLLGVMYGSNIA